MMNRSQIVESIQETVNRHVLAPKREEVSQLMGALDRFDDFYHYYLGPAPFAAVATESEVSSFIRRGHEAASNAINALTDQDRALIHEYLT